MKENFKKISTTLSIMVMILAATIIVSFAYFTAIFSGLEDEATVIAGAGKMNIYYEGGEVITAVNLIPKEEPFATKVFTVTGTTNTEQKMYYNIYLAVTENTFSAGAIQFELSGPDVINPELVNIFTGSSNIYLQESFFDPYTEEEIRTYTIKFYFKDNDSLQNIDKEKSFSAYITLKEGLDKALDAANAPVLATGMTPIVYSGGKFVATTADAPNWYDYANRKWANAQTADGSYWVWIPRYAYRIETCYNMSHAQCNAATGKIAGEIDILFLQGETNTTKDNFTVESSGYEPGVKDTSMHYFLHPAFTFGEDELTGFWVAKFESSNNGGVVASKPNVTSWRSIDVKTMHNHAQAMKTNTSYGWNTNEVDSHMMKSTEWGAVTYLSKSTYGANEEVYINNNSSYITGCGGDTVSASSTSSCNAYNTEKGAKASTTHNIYGVYDMSGGAYEYAMAVANNLHASSGFTAQELSNIDDKYIDRYTGVSIYDETMYGDAVFETSNGALDNANSWFNDFSWLPSSSLPWVGRGGRQNNRANAGPFYFGRTGGNTYSEMGFRPVLVCGLVV